MNKRLARFFEQSRNRPDYMKKAHQAEIAADLRLLIANSGKSYKEVAQAAGISAPALSKKLGGDSNLTLDSILAIAMAVDADFDVVFRARNAPRAMQPWEIEAKTEDMLELSEILLNRIKVIHAEKEAMKQTWEQRMRTLFKGSPYRQPRPAMHMETFCANDDGPMANYG